MPELPEVHTFQQYFNAAALGRRIEQVTVHDSHILRNVDADTFARRLEGHTVVDSYRRGKYLFVEFDHGHHVLLHFGMTGDLLLYADPTEQPRHERFVWALHDGAYLGFTDPRKFARILYLEDRDAYIREVGLGPDALTVTETEFLALMHGKGGTLKGFLLNQHHLAGVGNLYADEICYRARLHPASRIDRLHETQRREVYRHLHEVLNLAVAQLPHYREYPEQWFWHTWRHVGAKGPEGWGEVKTTKVAGRTTYYCADWQKLW